MVRIRCFRTLATCTLTQTIGAKNVMATITTDNHDACGKDINLQMSVHMLVITLSGYAEVITEELYTTTFASG